MNKPKGIALVTSMLLTLLLLLMGLYFIQMSWAEREMSQSYANYTKAYYLAESGIEQARIVEHGKPAWVNGGMSTYPGILPGVTISTHCLSKYFCLVESTGRVGQMKVTLSVGMARYLPDQAAATHTLPYQGAPGEGTNTVVLWQQ